MDLFKVGEKSEWTYYWVLPQIGNVQSALNAEEVQWTIILR